IAPMLNRHVCVKMSCFMCYTIAYHRETSHIFRLKISSCTGIMQKILQDFSVPAAFAGFITFLVGISVSAVLVIQSAQLLGANTAEITSWFWALGLGIGLSGLILSWKFKYPVATSWSTAGLALILATANGYSMNAALGAFLVCGLLTAVLGFLGIFEKILRYIPQSLTSAMLAGVLLKFGIELF